MSFDQMYNVPSVESLLETLTGKSARQVLETELNAQGLKIEKIELEPIDGFYGDIDAEVVYLSDGRVFEPKLVRRETADGNWGNDVYEYRLKGEQVKIAHVDLSIPYENPNVGSIGTWEGNCDCDNDDAGC